MSTKILFIEFMSSNLLNIIVVCHELTLGQSYNHQIFCGYWMYLHREETDFIAFYDEQSSFVRTIPKHNVLVIGDDMNAQIGKNINHKFSLHNSSNRNGQHLTDLIWENRLASLNTNFQKREEKLWTYTYVNNTRAQLDYVFINKKWNNSALNCEAYSSFEGVSSNH